MATTAAVPQTRTPNQFHLHGPHISVSYYPQGSGPPVEGKGRTILTYQDAHQSLVFGAQEVRSVEVADLGTIVSVTLVRTIDVGSTTFSLIVPAVGLPQDEATVPVHTDAITTIHRAFVGEIGHPQHETYTVQALTGSAALRPLPL